MIWEARKVRMGMGKRRIGVMEYWSGGVALIVGLEPKRSSLTAENTARQSRNRETKADRKIEDRNIKRHPIFLSSIFLSLCLSAAPL
jgi:hypothetical protein